MQTSADFRSSHNVVASYKILRGVTAEKDFQLGWGATLKTPATDVIDVNASGQAETVATEKNGDGYTHGGTIMFEEPALAAPKLSEMERVAKETGKEVFTQEDFAQGLFLETVGAEGKEGEGTPIREKLVSANYWVASREPWDPALRFAVDVSTNEFLLYQ